MCLLQESIFIDETIMLCDAHISGVGHVPASFFDSFFPRFDGEAGKTVTEIKKKI